MTTTITEQELAEARKIWGDAHQLIEAVREQNAVVHVDRGHWERREDVSIVLDDGYGLLTLLVLVSRIANAVAALLGHGVGSVAMQHAEVPISIASLVVGITPVQLESRFDQSQH